MPITSAVALTLSLSLFGVVHAAKPAPQPPPVTAASEDGAAMLRKALAAIQANDLDLATRVLDELLASASFPALTSDQRYWTTLLAGSVASDQRRYDDAKRLLIAATSFKQASEKAWLGRLDVALQLNDSADAALSVEHISRRWPESVGDLNEYAIHEIARNLGKPGRETAYRTFLESLFDAGWMPAETIPDSYWVDLAGLLVANKQLPKAIQVALRVDDPHDIVAMRVDRRFDVIAKKQPGIFDIDRAIERTAEKDEERVKKNPGLLAPLVRRQSSLFDVLQFERVIEIADRVIGSLDGNEGSKVYKDFDARYVWILDQRAQALAKLGEWDEAVRQREKAARRPEHGGMNVSQVINLADLYNALGRANDAREAIGEIGQMSPYGRMQLEMVRLRAATTLGDEKAAADSLTFLREHRDEAIGTWQEALLCSGDIEGAAKLLVERLQQDGRRSSALLSVQNWAEAAMTPQLKKRSELWKSLIARPEVQAAIQKVGRTESFRLAEERT